jgi:ferredoxin-thioredoxin reductase catalytic chain
VSEEIVIPTEKTDALFERLHQDAEAAGYHLNPDSEFTRALVESLLINEERYGYQACPCRLATGDKEQDLDIICPCDYRDPDLVDWGACFCALYVSDEILDGTQEVQPVPERRPPEGRQAQSSQRTAPSVPGGDGPPPLPVWRCRVCGYLCAREKPPGVCPICKAKRERFEQFW